MDPIVLRAMQKWPDVPRVYGWLKLDRRGRYLVKGRSGEFERIGNTAVTEFIGRNYAVDERGRWFFQNGPQRVFVTLEYTPWVCRLNDASNGLVTHTGTGFVPRKLHLDEGGSMLIEAEQGLALLEDRDLEKVVTLLQEQNDVDEDQLLHPGEELSLSFMREPVTLSCVQSADVPRRFGFDPRPVPEAGEPEC